MSILYSKEAKITQIINSSVERSKALDDEARATILHLLSHRVLPTEAIVRELRKAGYNKATTTVRHHLRILKDCGLVEVVRIQEVRGTVLKYYASTAKFLGFENSFDCTQFSGAITETSYKLLKIALSLANRYSGPLRHSSSSTCPHCSSQHGKEYALLEIMNRAFAEMVQTKEFQEMMLRLSSKEKKKISSN